LLGGLIVVSLLAILWLRHPQAETPS
jgi:hypothetical protein